MEIREVCEVWNRIKDILEKSVPEYVFNTWITPIEAVDFENNTLILLSPHQMFIRSLKKDWNDVIKSSVKTVLGEDAIFSLNYDPELASKYVKKRKSEYAKIVAGRTEEVVEKENKDLILKNANLNLNLKFENFVVGENSKFAYNAAYSVANNPAKKFNPLFIYGASGLGKTHLLQSIGHYILFNTKLKVRYARMEEYFHEWVGCFQQDTSQNGKKSRGCNNALMRKFHQKFQNIDVLLMDDIQYIESKERTMDVFFDLFESLYTNNKQIVIASDRLPSEIPKLDNRLRTRFEMGLVVDITPPDYETRFEILKAYAKELDMEADDTVYSLIAENFKSNVRELKGAYNKVSAYAEFSGEGITVEFARKALNLDEAKSALTIDKLAQTVAQYFGLTVKDLKSPARQQKISSSRRIAVYLAREILNMSFESIGDYFAKRHTTIMYSCDLIKEALKTDKNLAKSISEIKKILEE